MIEDMNNSKYFKKILLKVVIYWKKYFKRLNNLGHKVKAKLSQDFRESNPGKNNILRILLDFFLNNEEKTKTKYQKLAIMS